LTKLDKLLVRFHAGSALSFTELQSVLNAYGFRLDRIAGSHHVYVRTGISRPISIQPDGKTAKRYQVKQLRDMIAEFGLEPEGR